MRDLLQYSANIGTSGFLRAVAGFTQSTQGHFILTNRSSQAHDLCATTFAQPGDTILVEDLTYFPACNVLCDAHLNLVPVRQTAHKWLDVDELQAVLEAGAMQPKLLYIAPSYNTQLEPRSRSQTDSASPASPRITTSSSYVRTSFSF